MEHRQLLAVITPDWNAVQGELHFYERRGDDLPWTSSGEPVPIVVGQSGMSWGIGLHAIQNKKREGDRKSPAGIFSMGPAFGHAASLVIKMDYIALTPSLEAVDDPKSIYYNQIVNRDEISHPDWQSSEKMAEIPLYDLGVVIHHNFPQPVPGAGSAIFFHIWSSDQSGTAGCTAMSRENLSRILAWLDKDKHPLLVQLPHEKYIELQHAWELPELQSASTAS